MKIVEKYLWQSVLVPLGFVIAALFTLWLTFDIFDKIGRLIDKGPPPWLLAKYFLVQLPDLAQSILPVGVLFATLYVLAYFSKHRESVALTAAGMSPLLLARPFLLCSAGLSLVLYFLSFSLSPSAQANREKVKRQIKKEQTEENSFSQVVYRSPKLPDQKDSTIWYIGRLNLKAQTLQNAEILFRSEPDGRDLAKVFAASGEYRHGVWHLQNARRIDYGAELGLETAGPVLAELQLAELTEPPAMLAAKLVPPDVLPWPEVARLAGDTARLNQRLRAPYATEHWHRWMYPLSCPLLCLFGIAFGLTDARRNVAATVFSSVFVLFAFLVFTRLCVALGQGNRIPPFLAGVLPIFSFGLAGLYLFAEKVGWLWELQGWSQEHPPRGDLAQKGGPRFMNLLTKLVLTGTVVGLASLLPVWASDPAPVPAAETAAEAVVTKEEPAPAPTTDPMAGEAKEATTPDETTETSEDEAEKKKLPPITPDLANLNLATDLELMTLDTHEKVYLPAGTYRQILRIPIDSPTMQSAQKTRRERRPEVKVTDPLPPAPGPEKKPLWIRYESLEKIKINDEERRGGLDVPINGPAEFKLRLWYAKSETADTASSVFYFLFGGLGYSVANLGGWSAGNTREIPSDFEYRLIRR